MFKKMCGIKLFKKWRAAINVLEDQVCSTFNNNVVSNLNKSLKKLFMQCRFKVLINIVIHNKYRECL